jgi:gliding motility-associated-like protein
MVTGMDANSCSSSDVITVQVLPLPTASISYVGNPFCQSGSVVVSRVGQAGGNYTSTTGLIIDAVTGEINLSSSTPGSYTVTYTFSNGSCSSKVSTEVTIFSLPNVSYLPSVNAVCIQANPFTLTGGSPAGGVYRGPGVLGDLFDPRTAGTGIHTIEYTYTNTKGCAMSATATIAVSAVSRGITPMLFPEVCVNATSFTLSVTSGIPPGGQFLGNGVMNNQFNPASAGIGIHIIRYLTPGVSGCTVLYTGTIQVNPKPALQVTAPQQVCEGTQVQINAQSAGDLFWSDSTSAALQIFNGVLTLRAIRTSTFLITCRDGKGCSNVQPVTIQVAVPPDARFQYDRNQYCNDGTVGVQLAGLSGGIFSSIPGIALNQTTGQINLSASQPGMYTIKYAVSNTAGCQSQFSSSIEIREKPVLAIVDLVLCQGNLQAITTTAALGGSSRWESNRNDIVEVDTQGVVRGLKAGQAQVKFTSPSGCSTSLSVTVKALPVLRGRNIVCKNDSIQLLVGTAAGLASQFTSLFPGIAGITSNGWIMGLKEGNALIRYQDADGCMATHPIQVDVVPERVTGPAVACEPATVRLDKPMQAVYGSSGYTFIYWKDPGQTVLLNNPMRIAESGKYYVQVRNGNGCKADKPVEVQVFIAKSLQPRRLDTVKTQNNTPIQLRGRPNGVAYLWSPAAGLNAATIQNPWFNYVKNMEYQVAVQTDSGCVVTDTVFVKAVDANVFVPTAFTPNRDGLNDKLTPICYSIQRISYFSVFNRWGELVFTTNSIGKGWDGTSKGSPAEPGTYVWMLEAVGLDGQLFRQKGTVVLIR